MRTLHPDLETSTIFAADAAYPFSLEGLVVKLDDGALFATWTSGGSFEPSEANVTRCSRSEDGGRTWAAARTLFAHPMKGTFTTVLDPCGGALRAYLNTYRDDTSFAEDMQSYISDSTDGGRSFSMPRSIPGCINNVHAKQALHIGDRLILPFSWRELEGEAWAYPTGAAGRAPVVLGQTIAGNILPDGLDDMARRKAYHRWAGGHTREYVGVLISDDQGRSYRIAGRLGGEPRNLCEPTIVSLSDGTLVMYIRSNSVKTLFESRSADGGETWSALRPLDLPTPITKVRLYRGPDGAIYLLHNPSDDRRSPLSLWVSRDDLGSFSEKIDLVTDDTLPLAYPDGFVDEEADCLCFAWEDRRNVYFSRFPLHR